MLGERGLSVSEKVLESDKPDSLWDELCFPVPNDPYMSPYCASDDDLKKFPPTKILVSSSLADIWWFNAVFLKTVELDPCLDDCVMFAKRLKSIGNDVSLDILKGLPHGFLNFSLVSVGSD